MNNGDAPASAAARTPAWLNWARVLMLIAASGAGYLAWVAIHHGSAAGCGAASGCSAVLQSRWAYWLNLPVSAPAVLVYLALFGSTILLQKNTAPDDQRGSWAAIIILSVIVAGSAFWFVSLQVFVIQSFCKYCLTAHACGMAAALICLFHIPYATDPDTPMWTPGSGKRGVPRRAVLSLVAIGLAGVAVLAAGQLLVQKERNVVKVLPGSAAAAGTNPLLLSASAEAQPPTPNAHLIAPRTLSLYSNQFVIKFSDVPMLGSPDAPNIIVCLLDYTCVHCRALHSVLTQASQQYSNQLGIVCLPMSLSAQCNPYIPKATSFAASNSCEYARLSLAVWHAKPRVHREFDDWLLTGVKPPPLDQAMEKAAQLLGAKQLQAALADPWVGRQLLTDCKIHRLNWLAVDSAAMPQIIMGNAVSSGPINSVQHLRLLLERYLNFTVSP
jgi:uncharacterized membrane protein